MKKVYVSQRIGMIFLVMEALILLAIEILLVNSSFQDKIFWEVWMAMNTSILVICLFAIMFIWGDLK